MKQLKLPLILVCTLCAVLGVYMIFDGISTKDRIYAKYARVISPSIGERYNTVEILYKEILELPNSKYILHGNKDGIDLYNFLSDVSNRKALYERLSENYKVDYDEYEEALAYVYDGLTPTLPNKKKGKDGITRIYNKLIKVGASPIELGGSEEVFRERMQDRDMVWKMHDWIATRFEINTPYGEFQEMVDLSYNRTLKCAYWSSFGDTKAERRIKITPRNPQANLGEYEYMSMKKTGGIELIKDANRTIFLGAVIVLASALSVLLLGWWHQKPRVILK